MKLWKTRKSTSCVSGNSKIDEQQQAQQDTTSKFKAPISQSTPVLGWCLHIYRELPNY